MINFRIGKILQERITVTETGPYVNPKMNRRKFIMKSATGSAAALLYRSIPAVTLVNEPGTIHQPADTLYEIFKDPAFSYHPFVRWWWNGNKIEAEELKRELRLLKDAGIGGVEINPVEFPSRFPGDDLGKPSIIWLSDEWIDMLKVAFDEAKALGMTCDLIVGSGWPFGAEYLEGDERARIVVIGIKKLKGPVD
jgi:sugar phosphate isomerase/epimerase